jgi:hypothetical protein
MKRLLSLLICAFFGALQVYAYDFSVKSPNGQTLYYNIINQEQKQVELVSEYTGNDRYETPPAGDLIITSEVEFEGETYSVISIQESCFRYCTKITSVIVEEGIKRIGNDAFGNCSKIKSIVLPNSLEELDYPFVFCTSLQSITLSNSLTTICDGLFWGCESLESVEIPNSVTSMGTSVFYICTNLKSVTLPEGLTKIKQSTFAKCNNLSSVNIPSTVTSIGMEAFLECENLTSIVIPASVQDIDVSAFINCENLQTVVIESETPPSLGENAFPRNENLKIYVPCDAIDDYLGNEDWMPYKSMITSAAHKVFVKSSNNEYGYVTIEEKNACSEEHTAIITAYSKDDDNYQFNRWDDGNKDNPRTITVTEDLSFTAIFGKKPKILNQETTNPICTSATGSASFDVTNGVSPYTVLWNDGNTDNPRSEMTPGKYYFVATDAEGFTSDTTYVTLYPNEDNMPQISLDPTDPICETENGEITATVSEGTEPYTYNWGKAKLKESTLENFEDGIINNQFYLWEINIENGDYYIVDIPIENSGAASSEQAIHVQGNENDNVIYLLQLYLSDELSLNHATSNSYGVSFYHKGSSAEFNISIDGYESNGNFTIPYHSDWTKVDLSWQEMNIAPYQIPYISEIYWNINTNPDFWIDELSILAYDDDAESFSSEKEVQNLAAGQYMFSVTDSYGCKTIATTSLNKDYSVVPSIELNSSNPICETENGTITATVSEGTEPYTYKWSDGATNKDRENLAEGEYTLTATDAYGCATSETATLEKDYSILPKFSFDIKNPICETENGEITTTVTSGTEPYSFTWSTIQPELVSNFEDGLTNKIYTNFIIFNDANYGGTTKTDGSGIADDGALGTAHSVIIKASSISKNIMGDYAGLSTYIGADLGGMTSLVDGISFYHKGENIEFRAMGEDMFTRTIPKHEDWTLVTYYFDEGFAPKDFYWSYRGAEEYQNSMQFQIDEIKFMWRHSSDVISKDQNGLSAGTYKLKVTDTYGCEYTNYAELTKDESNKPVLTKTFTNAICGHDVGEITISYEKGNEPVEYSWEDGSTDLKRENLAEGTYTFTITDAYGCTVTDETEIEYESFKYQPELALVTVSQESPANLVIWQKEETEAINFYSIYRETADDNVYEKIGDIPYSQTSIFVDDNTDSQTKAYRYKLSATDNCGNESPQSPNHKTIHVTINQGLNGVNNLIWDHYEGFSFSTYSIYRITTDGVTEIDKVPSSNWTFSDKNAPKNILSYYVAVKLPKEINVNDPFVKAESGPFSLAISNIAEVENQETAIALVDENSVNVYSSHNAIVVENAGENQIVICNAIGQTIARAKGENNRQKIFTVEAGIYIVIVGNKAFKVAVE